MLDGRGLYGKWEGSGVKPSLDGKLRTQVMLTVERLYSATMRERRALILCTLLGISPTA
jgi:hypothetical protein